MTIKFTNKIIHKILCLATALMFFVPLCKKVLFYSTLNYTSPYIYATGGNWLTSPHKYIWLMLISPLVMFLMSFAETESRTKNEIVIGACGINLLLIWTIASTEKILLSGIIYIVLVIVTALTGLIRK